MLQMRFTILDGISVLLAMKMLGVNDRI